MKLPEIFQDTETYRAAFAQGLWSIVQQESLGAFILALANATYDAKIWHVLEPSLKQRFQEHSAKVRQALLDGCFQDHAPDDMLVFLKLMAVGLDELQSSSFREAGAFQVQYNHLRAFRPPRMSNAVVTELLEPFDERGFHFNKPFLKSEMLWHGRIGGRDCAILYNKFPFADLHGLLVVDGKAGNPQYLDEAAHLHLWELCDKLGSHLPGVGFGYNGRGAYSSVNHQHFQMYVQDEGRYPIESPHWQHNGGEAPYPLATQVATSAADAWQQIDGLHQKNCTYNLLYRPGLVYITPRRFQGSYTHSNWTGGFAWAEVAGSITTFNAADYHALTETMVAEEMARMR